MGKKKKPTVFEKMEQRMAERNRCGKAFEVDFIDALEAADRPEQVSAMYILGLVLMRHHKAGPRKDFIDWKRINDAIREKFGAQYENAFKGYANSRIKSYGLHEMGMEGAAKAVAALMMEQAKQMEEQAAS